MLADGSLSQQPYVEGEIALRGDHVIHDYLEPHSESFKDDWFLTGDLGYLDEDGYLFVKGRRKEMINRGGEKVAPAKVENILNELDWVAQVAVIGFAGCTLWRSSHGGCHSPKRDRRPNESQSLLDRLRSPAFGSV